MRRAILTAMALALGVSLLTASGAGAAAKGGEFGDTCEGTRSGAPYGAAFETSRTGASMPLAAPTSGVLTKWIAYMPALFPAEGVPPLTVRVVRVVGPGRAEVTAKAPLETLRPGRNEFAVLVSEHERDFSSTGMLSEGVFPQFPLPALAAAEAARGTGPAPLLGRPVCPPDAPCQDAYGVGLFRIVEK